MLVIVAVPGAHRCAPALRYLPGLLSEPSSNFGSYAQTSLHRTDNVRSLAFTHTNSLPLAHER